MDIAVLGGGCFWCIEALYKNIKGVVKVEPGYSGGDVENPTYEEVSAGNTGHAEVVRVEFDNSLLSYEMIIKLFFVAHDPTTLNRQGFDVGTQYRSVIFYLNDYQKKIANKVKEELKEEKLFPNPIVTEIKKLPQFYLAEEYHHNYFEKNPNNAFCQTVINPKLNKLKSLFSNLIVE
ncbi:peptide-methionine (S)-S-oxide reductase MsrA [Marinilabiliaceae bacterium ANBcel2]|nr:peptide-methionine (S)-S-oxide reductase MsrA [Marinilabiliaceae bacterium ANBcel2]